jgi:predicted nucleotidyltransferase component of viral defense system
MSKDLERSLKDRIKAIAKAQNRAFNDLWKTLVLERFLVRLARSDKLDHLIFKGGFLLSKYLRLGRETADLDFSLKQSASSIESVRGLVEEILSLQSEDGFTFTQVNVNEMNHPHMEYPGYEVSAIACLGQTRTTIKIDLGIGDKVSPESRSIELLALNNKPLFETEISLQVYPLSYIFAEKLEAVVYRGGTNSRMKDFYDISLISVLPEFDRIGSSSIVRSVFEHRKTAATTELKYDDQAIGVLSRSWRRFLGALEDEFSESVPSEFNEVVVKINALLEQVFKEESEANNISRGL